MDITRPKLLFVDDESSLRQTIPLILEPQGFDVVTAADVTSALELITRQPFDVLLSDLNMGEISDGFTVVSAMRRLQPKCRTLILTGYPDFQGAVDRLVGQADGFILKPARPEALATRIRERLEASPISPHGERKKLAELLRQSKQCVLEKWKASAMRDPLLNGSHLPDDERMDRVPAILDEVIAALSSNREAAQSRDQFGEAALEAARHHGRLRQQQGYTLEQLFREIRVLQCHVFELVQENLLEMDLSAIIPELTVASDTIEVLLAASIRAHVDAERKQAVQKPLPKS